MPDNSAQFARRIVASYLFTQAIGTLAWWCVLWTSPPARKWFQPHAWPEEALLSFWLPDLALIVLGSVAVAWGTFSEKPWATLSVWALAGAAWYATLYCIGCSVSTGEAWIAAACMSCMSGLTLAMATIYGQPDQAPATFRTTPMSPAHALLWSLLQVVVFWGGFLWILPMGILELQLKVGLAMRFEHPWQTAAAVSLFGMASAVGMSSCIVFAVCGEGTPLPTANAPKLVVAGPYRLVRNPMALAGITQGLAMGWYLGSWLVIVYALAGAFVWHIFVRPFEEAEMNDRFGDEYRRYQKAVRLWIPVPREPFR